MNIEQKHVHAYADVELREARIGDVADMANLERICFKAPWSEAMLDEELHNKDARYIVVERIEEHELIGHAGYWSILNEAHITNIVIAPDFQGRGYGELLLRKLLSMASKEDLQHMTLEVRESNLKAQRLYNKLGFINVGTRPRYYPDGENAFIFWKHGI